MGFNELAAGVAEGVDGVVDEHGGGEFAGRFTVRLEWGGKCGHFSGEGELSEGAMHLAARVDALDDLLTEITTLGEMQSVSLGGFLREIFFGDVDAEVWHAGADAEGFDGFGGEFDRA